MACNCYIASIKVEVARGDVDVETCATFSDNIGYYSPDAFVEPGDGHGDRVFGKRKRTSHNENGDWWESQDYGTNIRIIGVDPECDAPTTDTNFDPEFDYGLPIVSHGSSYSDEFENPVTDVELKEHAESHIDYGDWENVVAGESIIDFLGHEQAANAGEENGSPLTEYFTQFGVNYNDPSVPLDCFRTQVKYRFTLARAKLHFKVKYDIWDAVSATNYLSDQSFTLDGTTSPYELEVPVVEDKELLVKNVRYFPVPFDDYV